MVMDYSNPLQNTAFGQAGAQGAENQGYGQGYYQPDPPQKYCEFEIWRSVFMQRLPYDIDVAIFAAGYAVESFRKFFLK